MTRAREWRIHTAIQLGRDLTRDENRRVDQLRRARWTLADIVDEIRSPVGGADNVRIGSSAGTAIHGGDLNVFVGHEEQMTREALAKDAEDDSLERGGADEWEGER